MTCVCRVRLVSVEFRVILFVCYAVLPSYILKYVVIGIRFVFIVIAFVFLSRAFVIRISII